MKYDEAMKTEDKKEWNQAVKEELEQFEKYNVFKAVPKKEVTKNTKILTTTWTMKKKSSGRYRARMNMRGYEQVDGKHFDSASISVSVTNDLSI
jgi:arginine utilization protein RocB